MEEEFFMAVKRTEHVEVTSRSVAASARGKEGVGGVEQPKMSTLGAAVDDESSKKPSSSSSTAETDESSGVFGCSFSGDDFAGELAPLYTDFDLLSDFAEQPMDFLSNLPEPAFAFSSDCSSSAYNPCPPSPAALQQADAFFEDITDLFQIDPLPVI
uniref:Uncharacterized protein n=1 Tax=Aegilops tauschii TaxID=37682 RepID=M8BV66_AEGTA